MGVLRVTPELDFRIDRSTDEAERITRALENVPATLAIEKDEDGYSLSGEAKDATASRNGLSRNQMGIEEKAAECKEAATVLANGNAL